MKRIAFIGLYDEHNYGDPIIGECTEWLFKEHHNGNSLTIQRVPLDYVERYGTHSSIIDKIIGRIGLVAGISRDEIDFRLYKRRYLRYYEEVIDNPDLIVVTGGGLIKFSTQFFGYSLAAILEFAKQRNLPVVFNAVGVEGYDESSFKCRKLKALLLHPSLKSITTRDDIDILSNKYLENRQDIYCAKICDPAVWASEAYGVSSTKNSEEIGIGIIRADIFQDYGIPFTANELENLYVSVCRTLINNGAKIRLFTNGLHQDNAFCNIIHNRLLSLGYKLDISIPNSPKELVEIIAGFKSVIVGRLHAFITAYSLSIPAIGLVWNDKLTKFGNNIGYSERMIQYGNLNSEYIVKQLQLAEHTGYDNVHRNRFRRTIVDNINNLMNRL